MQAPNGVVRFTKERDEHGGFLLLIIKTNDGKNGDLEIALTQGEVIDLAKLLLDDPGRNTVVLNSRFTQPTSTEEFRTVAIGEVDYEYYSSEMSFKCKCGEHHFLGEGGDSETCACGKKYRQRHALEVANERISTEEK